MRLTLREALRRRVLQALAALSLVAVLLTAWGYSQLSGLPSGAETRLPDDQLHLIASQLLILVMFMFSFVLALFAVFAAAPTLAGELESGEALAVLARPIPRRTVLLGKWLGLAAVILVYSVGACASEFAAIFVTTGFLPPYPLAAALYIAAEGIVLLSLAMLLSTRLSAVAAGIVAVLLFGLAWIAGVVGGIAVAFGDPVLGQAGTVARLILPTDGLWRGAIYSLEPAAVLIAGSAAGPQIAAFPFFAPGPPPLLYLAWCVAWTATVLALAAVSFARRDL